MEKASKPQERHRSFELLHLDVPLISTRRSSPRATNPRRAPAPEYAMDTSRRVPFLWERAPGVPKDCLRSPSSRKEEAFFPPKPPPGRRRLSREVAPGVCCDDDGNEGDVDSCSYGDSFEDDDALSDRIGKVSLPDSSTAYNFGEHCIADDRPAPPSFIMNRFLPAANALAAHSTPRMPKHQSNRPHSTLSHRLQRELIKSRQRQAAAAANSMRLPEGHQQPQLPTKACGLQAFFPWTFKQAPCGVRSPIRCQAPRTGIWKTKRFSTQRDDDNVSSKACKSPGWGLPFLDTSRLRRLRTGNGEGRERGAEFMSEFVGERSSGKPEWSLPRLRTPSEPWLQHALKNNNRRY